MDGGAGSAATAESMRLSRGQPGIQRSTRGTRRRRTPRLTRRRSCTSQRHTICDRCAISTRKYRERECRPGALFGSDVFVNRALSAAARGVSAQNTPLARRAFRGPDCVLGPGGLLKFRLLGEARPRALFVPSTATAASFSRKQGSIDITGLPLGKAQTLIEGALKQQYRNAQVAVTVSRLRSVRVYVIGDVQRPGGYDISSLSTPVSAFYAAGGPTAAGSLRTLRHYRGKQLVEEVDLYDFLLHGIRNGSASFESGDTLLVPPAGPLVAVSGAVKRPAIYELDAGESTLATVIDDAGGFTAAASLSHIRIERIDANRQRQTLTLSDAANQSSLADHGSTAMFPVKDGDRVRVDPILPYSQSAIYLSGHVVRPGRPAHTDGMRTWRCAPQLSGYVCLSPLLTVKLSVSFLPICMRRPSTSIFQMY